MVFNRHGCCCCCSLTRLLTLLVLNIYFSSAFDIHISENAEPMKVPVFNCSLGENWTYSFDRFRTPQSVLQHFQLDSSNGHLYISRVPNCKDILTNPVQLYIMAHHYHVHVYESNQEFYALPSLSQTVENYTISVINVHFRELYCNQKYRRKILNSLTIISSLKRSILFRNNCLKSGHFILSLSSYIPSFIRKCVAGYSLTNSNEFEIDSNTTHLRALSNNICVIQHDVRLFGFIHYTCDMEAVSHYYPFLIILRKPKYSDSAISNSVIQSLDQQLVNGHSNRGRNVRLRRRASDNHAPHFAKTSYEQHILEEQGPGITVMVITATDSDPGDAGTVTYNLQVAEDGRSQSRFAIEPHTGRINTTRQLDREVMNKHQFIVFATDYGRPRLTASTSLTIIVDDDNDNEPLFERSEYVTEKSEYSNIGTTVITVHASDKDIGLNGQVRYNILNPSGDNRVFSLDPVSGSITLRSHLDRETVSSYTISVEAVDQGTLLKRLTSTATVKVTVIDENDNRPQFGKASYTVDVREDIDTRSKPIIAHILATDKDLGPNGNIRYSIQSGNKLGLFSIDGNTGVVSVTNSLNYETKVQHSLYIRAQDSGNPPKTNATTLLVRVLDVNDNPPTFYAQLYQESIKENVATGYSILLVEAYDPDANENSDLVYRIRNPPTGMPITIDAKSGWIKTTGKLDREQASGYSLVVDAHDQGDPPQSSSTSVVINIRDVNDNPPIFNPRVYYASVSEEASPGHRVTSVTAVDRDERDNARVTYAIQAGNANAAFRIITLQSEGVISVARSLNFKQQSKYVLTVTAMDTGGLIDTTNVFINITDINRHDPHFEGTPYKVEVLEDVIVGTVIKKVIAFDNDFGENARVTYSLQGTGALAFRIDPNSGEVRTRLKLDREHKAGYVFNVIATDHGTPPRTDITDLEIIITDANDNAPEFTEVIYYGKIFENVAIGTSVMTVHAEDRDVGENGRIYYTFNGGDSGNGAFEVDRTLGVIRTAKELDRETVATYDLRVMAVDEGQTPLSTSVVVNIKVQDINDNAPQFDASTIDIYVKENSPIGSTVGKIIAHDADVGINAQVEYSIKGGPDANSFSLTARPGDPAVLTNLVQLDFESQKKVYELTIQAASAHRFSKAKIVVRVQDVNDNVPKLNDFMIIFNNFVGYFPKGVIGRVPASDPDKYDRLVYTFLSGNEANLLHLNTSNGELMLNWLLNSDVPRNSTFHVQVSDGQNDVRATCHLYVRLVTEDMLMHSVTIRLNNMTQTAFLSPLFRFFVDALAVIMHTDKRNIFIFNVQDDIDVTAQILNVSVSVREKIIKGKDVFYSPDFLKEQIYLQRILLADLSTLQVLPFDDNLCVQELCPYFEVCESALVFGKAAPFISSQTMLFRPIHPKNFYKCQCPKGFTGMDATSLCDAEVTLCYSNPCNGNGTCVQKEGGYTCLCAEGFTGKNCEVDMRTRKYDQLSCPADVCRPPSYCQPLIRGGFRCEACPDSIFHNQFCQLTARSFTSGSYLTFPSLKSRHRFTIQLRFATWMKNALILYNGRYNEQHDFIALEIVNGTVRFSFSLGANITTVTAKVTRGVVNNGEWHLVKMEYLNRTVTLTIGEDCDSEISVRYGDSLPGYNCAARTTHYLPKECDSPTNPCFRLLDLAGPFQLGGLPSLPSEFQVHNKGFIGCIKDVYVDHALLDMNSAVAQNGTVKGCSHRENFCLSSPCKNGGTCHEGWDTYICDCPSRSGGKDCSQIIEIARRVTGTGYMLYRPDLPAVQFPWYNGVSFRTREATGLLMQVEIADNHIVKFELLNGYVQYEYDAGKVIVFDDMLVNDGKWHYVEARWIRGQIILTLEYGQLKKILPGSASIFGRNVERVYVGGRRPKSGVSAVGFSGCLKNINVGNNQKSYLRDPQKSSVFDNCDVPNPCSSSPCGFSACVNEWGQYSCKCAKGRLGPSCDDICESYNPCQHWSTCRRPGTGESGDYVCECGTLQSGHYCEQTIQQPCPSSWWGYPICGPCNCDTDKGFNPSCNQTNGQCSCKDNHYRPSGSSTCYKCDCFEWGSKSELCHPITGQCACLFDIKGRRCNLCDDKFAEIGDEGCKHVKNMCPFAFAEEVWWDKTHFNETAVDDCPRNGEGVASRHCTSQGWEAPNFFNCTSQTFLEVRVMLGEASHRVNEFVSKTSMRKLANASLSTERLFSSDVNITYELLVKILLYENKQSGLKSTFQQDRNFIQNLVTCYSKVLSPEYLPDWIKIRSSGKGGAVELINLMEIYLSTVAHSMAVVQGWPFDVTNPNIMFGVSSKRHGNSSEQRIPKSNLMDSENNGVFDKFTHFSVPPSVIPLNAFEGDLLSTGEQTAAKAYVGYIMYRTMGDILPKTYDASVKHIRTLIVNSPVVTVIIRGKNFDVKGPLKEPIKINFYPLQTENRTDAQCAYWKYNFDNDHQLSGSWSTDGCTMVGQLHQYSADGQEETLITCSCTHLSSYALIMEVSTAQYFQPLLTGVVIARYIISIISLVCIFISILVLVVIRRLWCNLHSITVNFLLAVFLFKVTFAFGIDKTELILGCRFVAIILHYFCLSAFAWLFVKIVHVYRMMVEIRNINHGSMKFYYVLGYVFPGIVVGLAVGLYTDAYGSDLFCWLSTSDQFVWSFVGPVIFICMVTVITAILAIRRSAQKAVSDSDTSTFRMFVIVCIFVMLILNLDWIFGLMAINQNSATLHHFYLAITLILGIYIITTHVFVNKEVMWEVKRCWHICHGEEDFDEKYEASKSPCMGRSALAYRHSTIGQENGIMRANVGISTTSTTSHTTSKTSSGALYKPDNYLHSTGTSTSTSGHVATGGTYPPNTGIPPYGYDSSAFHDKLPDNPELTKMDGKRRNTDSDSDSDISVGHDSLDLASSHSSDDDDDEFDVGPRWGPQVKRKDSPPKQQDNNNAPGLSGTQQIRQESPPVRNLWPGESMVTIATTDSDICGSDDISHLELSPEKTMVTPKIFYTTVLTDTDSGQYIMSSLNSSPERLPLTYPITNTPERLPFSIDFHVPDS